MNKRIGVYICHCGGNISDVVDVEKVRSSVEQEEGVFLAKTTMFACSDSGQKEMIEDIRNNQLDGLVVASCSPKLHLLTFRAVSERANLNKFNYIHANIREQVSWAHSDDKAGATEKAVNILRSAIAKVRYAESLKPIKISLVNSVAVIGGGVSGMKAATELSNLGCKVFLIEKKHFVGGRVAQWDMLFTTNETGKELITRLYNDLIKRKNITVYTGAEVFSYSGSIGDFKLKIRITPRFIRDKCNLGELQNAIDACPIIVPDDFNFNITVRKAIYHNFPGEYPQAPVIDIKNCTRCGACEKICENIDFTQKEEVKEINVGSVLMATGFDPYTPVEGEYGYNSIENVITLPQFMRLIDLCNDRLTYKNRDINNIAFIYCVGSRQVTGENKFCSRYCCTSAIHAANTARKKFGDINNFHFSRGIRTYGKQEVIYDESCRLGDIYLQSYEDDPPTVRIRNNKTVVRINDILTGKKEMEIEADLVVLVTGMIPRKDNSVGTLLKLPRGRDKFLNEIHMKLRPVETVIDGITISGACQGPKNITETINSSLSAAAKSYSYVSKEEMEIEPIIAKIDRDLCTWCNACSEACPYDAVKMEKDKAKDFAVINNSICKGCGMCVPACPANAIDLTTYSDREIESMIDALA